MKLSTAVFGVIVVNGALRVLVWRLKFQRFFHGCPDDRKNTVEEVAGEGADGS